MTKREAVEMDGHLDGKTFDYALPQTWLDDVHRYTGQYSPGLFVWLYDDLGSYGGRPYGLLSEAWDLLRRYNRLAGVSWPITPQPDITITITAYVRVANDDHPLPC